MSYCAEFNSPSRAALLGVEFQGSAAEFQALLCQAQDFRCLGSTEPGLQIRRIQAHLKQPKQQKKWRKNRRNTWEKENTKYLILKEKLKLNTFKIWNLWFYLKWMGKSHVWTSCQVGPRRCMPAIIHHLKSNSPGLSRTPAGSTRYAPQPSKNKAQGNDQ